MKGNQSGHCDLLIQGGTVIDGSGAAGHLADVGINGDRITAVGTLRDWRAARVIEAGGLAVAPGFIDVHTHDDRAVLASPDMTAKVSQGVTTVVTGNCGVSLPPLCKREPPPPLNLLGDRSCFRFAHFSEYTEALKNAPPALNVAMLVGHSTLRVAVMEDTRLAANAEERRRMGELLDEALENGCIGMSTGLAYAPARAAPIGEVAELAQRVAAREGIYTTHMRDEGIGVADSVRETLEVGRRAGIPVVISHHKCSGRSNWDVHGRPYP